MGTVLCDEIFEVIFRSPSGGEHLIRVYSSETKRCCHAQKDMQSFQRIIASYISSEMA